MRGGLGDKGARTVAAAHADAEGRVGATAADTSGKRVWMKTVASGSNRWWCASLLAVRSLLALSLAASCRAEPAESGSACDGGACSENDGDDSGTDACEAAEVWCDGIDQDCDGVDSTEEIPYDGSDQDCDGFDLVDVDGDGFDAEVAGGDDCDDADAGAHPGAAEAAGDAADNDCDGHADELVACPDGSGDALTIQGTIDAASDGGAVEICPGRWTRAATAVDRVLTIYGGGEMPGDTILDSSRGTPVLTISGQRSVVTLDWLSLQGDDVEDQLVGFSDGPAVELRRVDISDDGEATAGMIYLSGACEGEDGSLAITLSRVRGEVWLSGACVRAVTFAGNTISGSTTIVLGEAQELAEFRNNIVAGDAVAVWLQYSRLEPMVCDTPVVVSNNVFASTETDFVANLAYGESTGVLSPVTFSNNIFQATQFGGLLSGVVYAGLIYSTSPGTMWCNEIEPEQVLPELFANLHWQCVVPTPPGVLSCSTAHERDTTWTDADAFEEAFGAGVTEADPEFSFDEEHGSYGLSEGSPAVDAGAGDDDPDASPPDIGAFGGPGGNWFLEYPWPLD